MSKIVDRDAPTGIDTSVKIYVTGIGGCGCKIINKMVNQNTDGVTYIAIDTDQRDISDSKASIKIWAGERNYPYGTGARMDIGKKAVEEKREQIQQAVSGCDAAILTAGIGGGTGTGGCQVVATITRALEVPTVAVVTSPFKFEGRRRINTAMDGINLLRDQVNRLIILPNERVLEFSRHYNLIQAFEKADEIVVATIGSVINQIRTQGCKNFDLETIDIDL